MNEESEMFLNLIMELRSFLPREDFYELVLSNFSEEDLMSYKDKHFNRVVEKLTQEGKMKEVKALQEYNAAYENKKILLGKIKNSYLDN